MFVEEPSTKEGLLRMARRLTSNSALRDDLLQEALIHLWLTEVRRPGQTKSWYLQSCKFHLLHYLASGRSVDSGKRRGGQLHFERDGDGRDGFLDVVDPGGSVLNWVSARELISLLSRQLLPRERAVLDCLADGLGPREIGRRLRISHTMVIKHRRKIASLLTKLEVPSISSSARFGINGAKPVNGTNGVSHVNGARRVNGDMHPAGSEPAGSARVILGPIEIHLERDAHSDRSCQAAG